MHFESHQTEDCHREEHWIKIGLTGLIKSCQQNLDHLRGIFQHYYSSYNGGKSELLTQCLDCMCIEDLYSNWSYDETYAHSGDLI